MSQGDEDGAAAVEPPGLPGGASRRFGWAWLVPALWLVVAGSWWPFVPVGSVSAWGSRARDAAGTAWVDPLSGLLVGAYVLVGGVVALAFPRAGRRRWWWLVLPLLVEAGQTPWIGRHAQWADVALGVAALLIGAWAGRRLTRRAWWARLVERRESWSIRMGLLGGSLACSVVLGAASWWAWQDAELAGWDASFPVLLGNEATGTRPWFGEVSEVLLRTRGKDGSLEVSALFMEGSIQDAVRLTGEAVDVSGGLWSEPRRQTREGLSAFELDAAVTPTSVDQSGPARVVTWSNGTSERNFTLGQDGDALVLRVRTAGNGPNGVGVAPARWPGVFEAGEAVRLETGYRDGVVELTVNGEDRAALPMHTPVRVMGGPTWMHGMVFGAVMALPLAWLCVFLDPRMPGRLAFLVTVWTLPMLVVSAASAFSVYGLGYWAVGWLAGLVVLPSLVPRAWR